MIKNAAYIKTRVIKWLINKGLSFDCSKDAIGVEVLFSPNMRRADLLILSSTFHALEIKSDFDNDKKLRIQLLDYLKTFDKTSIVTTPKHIIKITRTAPLDVGIILFQNDTFEVKRPARKIKLLDKISILMFLSKKELMIGFKLPKSYQLSTQELRLNIAENHSIDQIIKYIYPFIRNRYKKLFQSFLADIHGEIIRDELRTLSGKVTEINI